jgi:hypothetical protein
MDDDDSVDGAWKLKLRYGRIETPYSHFTLIAEGVVGELADGFSCRPGKAFMGMKVWASSHDEATDMIRAIGKEIGFELIGRVQIYKSEPAEPPRDNPLGYDINFTPFDD